MGGIVENGFEMVVEREGIGGDVEGDKEGGGKDDWNEEIEGWVV